MSRSKPMSSKRINSRINKACDECRVRKVKCNGTHPCSQCAHLDLACHFSPAAGKRKPGVRGRLVAQLREKNAANATITTSHAAPTIEDDISQHQQQLPLTTGLPQQQLHHWNSNTHNTHHCHQYGAHTTTSPSSSSNASIAVASVAGIIHSDNPHHYHTDYDGAATSPPVTTDYSPDFFLNLLPPFESIVYPFNPTVTPDELRAAIANMHQSHEDAALVYAFAAVVINLTQTSWTLHGDVASQMTDLMQRCLAAHRRADLEPSGSMRTSRHGSPPILPEIPVTVKRITTCLFLEVSTMAFRHFNRAFAILREAIALVQTLKVYQYTTTDTHNLPPSEIARLQRCYWECFIHERFVNIMSGCPSVLPPLSTGLPIQDPTIPEYVDVGFRRLICLFRVMDDSFLAYWNAEQDPGHATPDMTAEWVERKQAELDADELGTMRDEDRMVASASVNGGGGGGGGGTNSGGLTELQHADLFITRLWLRTLVWQLALSRGLLRSAPPQNTHQGLSLHFPAHRLSAQLRSLVSRLESVASIGTHGSGILQKLFEITTTVSDVLALPPGRTSTQADVKARLEDFIFVVAFLFRFERISKEERDYMREKLDVLQHLYTVVDFGNLAVGSA